MQKFVLFLIIVSLYACNDASSDNKSTNNSENNYSICQNPGGNDYNYVISDIYIPKSTSEGIGLDFDDNGSTDNKMASLMASLLSQSSEFDINETITNSLSNGNFILLATLKIDDFTGDNNISSELFEGNFTGDSTENIFNGQAVFSPKANGNTATLCGRIYGGGIMEVGPGNVTINIPIEDANTLSLHLYYAQMKGMASENDWTDVILAGVLLPDELKNSIIPQVVSNVNDYIEQHPENSDYLLSTFDNKCSDSIEGCANNPDCADDGIITETEFSCNSSINTILTPDITIDGTDYVSFAVKLQAVKAIIE